MPKKNEELDRQLNEEGEEEEKVEEEKTEEGFVEIDGEKFKEDPNNPGEALPDEEGNAIPFEEKEEEKEEKEEKEGFVEIDGVKYKEDPENKGEALKDDDDKPIPFVVDEASKKKDRWHGKSREEVIKEYETLEKKKPEKPEEKTEEKTKEEEEKEIKMPSEEELKKMTPKLFAEWIMKEVDRKVSKAQDERSATSSAVTKEIKDAKKDHPLLSTSAEYRELVLALIDAAAGKGKGMALKEACEKVDAYAGKEKGEDKISTEEKAKLKKAKAQVEKEITAPTPGEKTTKESERIGKALGPKPDSSLGGL